MIAEYFRAQSEWRRLKAAEYPDDGRNAQSAAALESLADYVDGEERDDRLIAALQPFASELTLGGEETARRVSRYGFGYNATSPAQHEEFLEELRALCLYDAYEFARQSGVDFSGELHPGELDAARRDVSLPLRYFERRAGSTEGELEEAIASYVDPPA